MMVFLSLPENHPILNGLVQRVPINCADSLVADIESLARYHGIHSRHFGFYRMLAHRFPFGIYYREAKTETQVFAVLDLRRDPNWIREELTGRNP